MSIVLLSFSMSSFCQLLYTDPDHTDPILLNNGGSLGTYNNKCQLAFGWFYNQRYAHHIDSRHDSGSDLKNSLDFYIWTQGQSSNHLGDKLMMSVTGRGVAIGLDPDISIGEQVIIPTGVKLLVGGNTTIDGELRCEKVIVESVSADFVFDEDYKMPTLYELEQFIKANSHLPNIPPAEITEKGVDVGQFTESLLQKIEELTLYTIEQQKLIDQLQERVGKLEQ